VCFISSRIPIRILIGILEGILEEGRVCFLCECVCIFVRLSKGFLMVILFVDFLIAN